ncbi:MAG: 6-phosphofructokinase [Ignavibacteriota bacterium]|jgi:6-phosphofructokinase 1|nr:MAG: 6-phosphofructokinase [Chlorobiota bacterium]MBE7477134.1 6-phosphofructokinase [Ignavibacteriales bacterium]MBL1121336.1 6-phosphofructokinase [Ignavibacteriota bacterium]MBV6419679.1 Pyrophosphate--fructose 6-phosphate 1-phosphotransferase [Ignavibacteriaceae bacterium]MCE7855170.1 6-phosphofructokinase [Ignavibacteria bacterium CHB3]MEB2295948.1 diphosphate--fructose-6-phosphate 1-phosphotransferase [Ignavibacteria bacterium]
MSIAPKKLAILVSGGPAPGINSVIGAATIRAEVEGIEVLGIKDGFKWIMEGDTSHVKELTIHNVSRIHFRGGSYIGISRANPTKNEQHLENTVTSLLRLDVDKLITIGGDDTAFSALKVNEMAAGRIKVVHVPKTIDNDLDLPHGIPTFGFQTARHIGVEIVKSIMVDAQTTSRWYFIVTMGRKAGHLALGIGKATGATITLIPEEFPGEKISLNHVVDVLVGSIIKRMSYGRSDGVAILAEGIVERLKIEDLDQLVDIERDAHDNIRIAEINFGEILKSKVQQKLKEFGIKITVVAKNIGYELRCADPIPFDMEYTRDLGFSASQFILDGGSGAMISIQNGRFVPLYFSDILDPTTKRTRVRMVDPSSESFYIARKYMLRLNKTDFEDPHELAKLAATAHISIDEFKKRFYYLIENDLMYKHLEEGTISFLTADSNVAFKTLSTPRQNGDAIE